MEYIKLDKDIIWKKMVDYSKIITILLFVIYIIVIFTVARTSTFLSKPFTIVMLILIPVILIGYLYLKSENVSVDIKFIYILISLFVIGVVVFLLYFYISSPKDNIISKILSYCSIFIAFAIMLVGLIIFYNVFTNSIKKQTGWTGFFTNLMFYLPCLITDYLKYLFVEFKNTPSIIFLFFILEIVLILLYIYIPVIINLVFMPSGITLLENPSFLTPATDLGKSNILLLDQPLNKTDENQIQKYNSNFSLSMWIFVNNTILGTNEQESILFKYGNSNDFYGKPCITYLGNDDWRFMFTNNTGHSKNTDLKYVSLPEYIVKMPSQKWHHIVFSYYDNVVDLFINGSLARNMDISSRLPIKNLNDKITIGSKDIPGAICNITYYKHPLTPTQISRIYNMLFMFNPPVNNLR